MENEPGNDASPIAVFGAGGKTGTEILRLAVRKDIKVRALEHQLPKPSDRVSGVEYVQCDVLNDDFASELDGCRAIISALGIGFSPSTAIDPPPLFTEGPASWSKRCRRPSFRRHSSSHSPAFPPGSI